MVKKILITYLIYFFVFVVLVFAFPKNVSDKFASKISTQSFYSDNEGEDRIIILDNPLESGLARLHLIEEATKTLDIAYFSIESGETPNVFFGALFDAADRGVQVNILLDGMFHGLRRSKRSIIYGIANHPNMNLKFYEKPNLLMPWTLNNRMHDKYIIVDNKAAIIGGRNIGDKYFAPEWYERAITYDRDVIILNNNKNSVIRDIREYFDYIWNYKYSKNVNPVLKSVFKKRSKKNIQSMQHKAALAKEMYNTSFEKMNNLYEYSIPTNQITFIHNPIERFSKEPLVWYQLLELSKNSKNSVFIQSPYIVPNTKMTKNFLNVEDLQAKNITILTNSLASTPNIMAFAGYSNYRKKIIDNNIKVMELQTRDSIHAKSFIIDDEIVAIGSFNLDSRSAFLSTESMVVIHGKDVVEKLKENILDYTDQSLLVDTNYKYVEKKGIKEKKVNIIKKFFVKIFSYIIRCFDYLL